MRKNIFIVLVGMLLLTSIATITSSLSINSTNTDFDPLVDIEVTIELQTIRWLEEKLSTLPGVNPVDGAVGNSAVSVQKAMGNNYGPLSLPIEEENLQQDSSSIACSEKTLTADDGLNLYVKVFINDIEFESDVWTNTKYIYDPQWTATCDVPDDEEFVNIKIQLWNEIGGGFTEDVLCDISGDTGSSDDSYDAELVYSIKTGYWNGDDGLSDPSGYGRLCGCDDGTIYKKDKDCEIWFNIYQNDFDGDNIPYWTEVNEYGTDPEVSNTGEDLDNDYVPIEWEWKWRYDPFAWENHKLLDSDGDSINNYEEYLASNWFSDPFRKDVFVELDLMEEGPNGELSYFPVKSKELIQTAFDRQNIVFHLDYGSMGGHEMIPFYDIVHKGDLYRIYYDFFLHGDYNNWRRGVFHYGVVVYKSVSAAGFIFRPNAFQISCSGHDSLLQDKPILERDIVYGSAYMHELGHTFGFWPIPGHNRKDGIAGLIDWLYCLPYKSCMNYGYMYVMVDYSDGSRKPPDLDDWDPSRMLFDYFESEWQNDIEKVSFSKVSQSQPSGQQSSNHLSLQLFQQLKNIK